MFLFFAAQRFFSKIFHCENGKWKMENRFWSILHFPFSILAVQTL